MRLTRNEEDVVSNRILSILAFEFAFLPHRLESFGASEERKTRATISRRNEIGLVQYETGSVPLSNVQGRSTKTLRVVDDLKEKGEEASARNVARKNEMRRSSRARRTMSEMVAYLA